ncbi:T9SS type A sorting domain-containing protein [Algoriphagus confluentis]|uniref:T9SS type A sorting domain-containing protein n=1 Tax=Algoriphagus confluentis TaxID=1697556 RepID=A0ABQ6PT94_9BACT|nr:hypothetical protein Aconfl_38110 [Algoriphagus confluentis]
MRALNCLVCCIPHFYCRIYRIILAVGGILCLAQVGYSQEIGAYKTIASGTFQNTAIWAVWNGTGWTAATSKPNGSTDIYIDQTHTLTLTGNEEAKNVFINAETGAGQKLILNGFNLDVYGSLRAFSGPAPGFAGNAWNSQNWIGNSVGSTLTFKGSSRTVVEKNSWSAQTTQSRYSVIFEADPGEQLVIESPFKALSFTVRSGSVLQKIDTSVIPNVCFTLSFNTETTVFGTGPFGELVIESGATFISECNGNILNRSTSSSTSALNFDLQNGGTLILEGSNPHIEAANFQLNGEIIHRGGSLPKAFLSSSYSDAATPAAVRDVELQGSQNLTLPLNLSLFGNLEKSGSGNFITSSTHLTILGASDQDILGFSLIVRDLTLNKSGGVFRPNSNLEISRNFTLTQGVMDLGGNNLLINTGLAGSLSHSGGRWRNVGKMTYFGLPATLNPSNATFPFEDTQNGGLRKVQLLGTSPGGNLSIRFTEYKGADFNPGFSDSDGTPILYRKFSYFEFSEFSPGSAPIELRISADQLIVGDVTDLRIVGTGYSAPGTHLVGQDPTLLWARRELTFSAFAGVNFTVGSFRTTSILPLTWLKIQGKSTPLGNRIEWSVRSDKAILLFEIHRIDLSSKAWEKVGIVSPEGNNQEIFEFVDQTAKSYLTYGYRILKINQYGESTWSDLIRMEAPSFANSEEIILYPNPYSGGKIGLIFPKKWDRNSKIVLQNASGQLLLEGVWDESLFSQFCENLPSGLYLFGLESEDRFIQKRWIKK